MPGGFNQHETERRKRALFNAAVQLPEAERAAFVRREAAADPGLRDSVRRLLHASGKTSDGVLDRPLFQRAPDIVPGSTLIGKYCVIRQLGSGGMGSVYCCRRGDSSGLVAVKVLRTDLRSERFLKRFERERTILTRLHHPNVCRILDAGVAEHGTPFIVMEMVDGEPIDAWCRRAALPCNQRLLLFSQALAGVEYFHRQNVIHRDLKPSNILVSAGKLRILDFGIGKFIEHRQGNTGHGPTRTTLPIMTVRYASPEQLQQRVSGRASDIYSLGLVLYELLTGRHPYSNEINDGVEQLLTTMSSRTVPPPSMIASHGAGISRSIDNMLSNALQFEPAARYASAQQFLEDLRRCVEGASVALHFAAHV